MYIIPVIIPYSPVLNKILLRPPIFLGWQGDMTDGRRGIPIPYSREQDCVALCCSRLQIEYCHTY
jgi:hypothetical protein